MFKKGDTVICLIDSKDIWQSTKNKQETIGPQKGDILIIERLNEDNYLVFKEYSGQGYNPRVFKKLNVLNGSLEIKLDIKKVLETEKIIAN